MTMIAEEVENLRLRITQDIRVRASLAATFAALLEELGPASTSADGTPMNLKIEPWPGGRWYRDLGDNNGHFWGNVQAIKRPTLLELCGPMFMSYPVSNNVQYRLSQEGDETVIRFTHAGFGLISDEHRKGVTGGWSAIHEKVRLRAEKK
jgi:hypothetical protein